MSRMYLKKKVEVVGTRDNPETFETGKGKLATDGFGVVFPAAHFFARGE